MSPAGKPKLVAGEPTVRVTVLLSYSQHAEVVAAAGGTPVSKFIRDTTLGVVRAQKQKMKKT